MTPETLSPPDTALLTRIVDRAFAQTMAMIHIANHRPDKKRGDPKVGGHPASCASSIHILGALHFAAREVHDYVCCKPHASPVDHSCHHLMQLFRAEGSLNWFSVEESKAIMTRLRKFPEHEGQPVFQSYHARSDPDSFHFLPSGSVGIPPVVSVYLALAHRYATDHGFEVPPHAHFWSLIGDSEFREGSLMEVLPDVAERQLGNVTWIVDYNRQNLDGTRIPNERGLRGADCDRIERTARDNGWRVLQVRHGKFREQLFDRPGGVALKRLLEGSSDGEEGLTDYEFQMLLLKKDPVEIRRVCGQGRPDVENLLDGLSDEDVLRAFSDLGGHCMEKLLEAYDEARRNPDVPLLIIAHTIKGYGLESAAHPANHSMLPSEEEIGNLLERNGLSREDPFALFPDDSEEGVYLAERGELFRKGIEEHLRLRKKNREWVRKAIEKDGGLPDTLGIDLSLFPMAHTQWMWGQLAAKLVRIGTKDEGGPETAVSSAKTLTPEEKRWKTAADMVLTLSPDVGTSTNISPVLDQRIYGPDYQPDVRDELEIEVKHPDLVATDDPWTRHIRFEIAEANCMSCAGAFGKMGHYIGLPFFPMMTVYDFFIKRALDQLYYDLYWGGEFVIVGTPSGVTLSPEGAQHSWKSDIQIPNLITWEPIFAIEMDWILSDALKRQMMDGNEGRRGVLIRAVTRGIPQGLLLENVKKHASSQGLSDADLLARVRADCLAGAYYLVDGRGEEGYEPGDNVVRIFAMGSVATEALDASRKLRERGVFADVIAVSSPELLLGILGEKDGYRHLQDRLGVDGDLHAVPGPESAATEAELVSIAGRRVPIVAVCDGEAGLLDNIGSIVGVRQKTLAVRKFSKCGRPDEVYAYQHLDAESIVEACGQVLSETALEDLRVPASLLERHASRSPERRDWRELWPGAHES
jgi:pyruvate dehydrogenase E1 component